MNLLPYWQFYVLLTKRNVLLNKYSNTSYVNYVRHGKDLQITYCIKSPIPLDKIILNIKNLPLRQIYLQDLTDNNQCKLKKF